MEPIVLAYQSSEAYWLAYSGPTPVPISGELPLGRAAGSFARARKMVREQHADLAHWTAPDGKVHLLTGASERRRRSDGIETHPLKAPLPQGSFCRIGADIYALSPACCYVFAAKRLGIGAACMLANEMCGTYLLPPTGSSSGHSVRDCDRADVRRDDGNLPYRKPLVTVADLRVYLASYYPPCTEANAARALRWAVDACRSPAEAEIAALFCLPYRYGGWNIALPVMNARIDLSLRAQRLLQVPYCSCDLLWSDGPIAVEYYGGDAHSGADRAAHDWEREVVIRDKGVELVTMNAIQLRDAARFGAVARYIKKRLGERYRIDEAKHAAAVRDLRMQLRDYERLRDQMIVKRFLWQ